LRRFFKSIVILINLLAALVLLIIYLSVRISPADFWIPALVGLAYPYFFLINVVFVLYWLFTSPKWSLISVAAILLGFSHLNNYFQFSGKQSDQAGIVVCSYNIKAFNDRSYKKATEKAQQIMDYLKAKEADIICLQEMSLLNKKSLEEFQEMINMEGLPTYSDAKRPYGPITLSRFPIIHKDEIHFEESGNMIILTDVVTQKDTLRIFNCHLESYRFTADDINSLDSLSTNTKAKNMKEFRLFGSKMKKAFIKRATQAEELRRQIEQSPYPVLVCGDFNDTPVSYSYNTVRGDLKDAFVESGTGIGNTYLGKLPSFRIDYIMHSSEFKAHQFKIDHVDYSDHYPVSCTLVREKTED